MAPFFRYSHPSGALPALPFSGRRSAYALYACHSRAQAGRAIPALGTTHADYFFGDIPCTRALTQTEVEGEYELNTGNVIIETLGESEPLHTPGIVVYQHGPFAGKDAHDAVHNAVVMEEVARMAWIARGINPQLQGIDDYLMNKHFMRKHGPNAYYGQK